MPVLQEKWVNAPLDVIRDLFERGEGSESSWGVKEFFEGKLKSPHGPAAVPTLNPVNLKYLHDGCLVRYIGMVQDQFDPEFYLKVYHRNKTPQCGLYSDLSLQTDVEFDHPSNVMADRQTLYCVPVPAECEWVKDINQSQGSMGGPMLAGDSRNALKRKHNDEDNESVEMGVAMEDDGCSNGEASATLSTKKRRSLPSPQAQEMRANQQGHDLNCPIPGEKGLPCLVKLYRDFDAFKVSGVIEVVGVLGKDPTLAPLSYQDDTQPFDTADEKKAHFPPPSLVPRLHAIMVHHLPHSNPLLPLDLPFPLKPGSLSETLESSIESCRTVLLDLLTQALCGDALAAEYTLLHLLSSVYGRTEVMALGKYSLNLSRWPGGASTEALYQLLQTFLTKCFLLPLTLENMNSWRFIPKKDYNSNRLLSSVLQLSPGTQILVDETALAEGQLTHVGVANLTALGNVIQWQRLSYDFQFHTTDFDCDLPVLITSEGKSMLKVDCHVPVVPAEVPAMQIPSLELWTALRKYHTLCRGLDYSLTDDMKGLLEEEFVRMRGIDPQIDGQQFHHMLSTARLVALSHGSCTLSQQMWAHTCQLEKQRVERLKGTGS